MFGNRKTVEPKKGRAKNATNCASVDGRGQGQGLIEAYRQRTFILGMLATLLLSIYGAFALAASSEPTAGNLSSPAATPWRTPLTISGGVNASPSPSPTSPLRELTPTPRPTVTASPIPAKPTAPVAVRKPTNVPALATKPRAQPTVTPVGKPSAGLTPGGTPTPVATRIAGSRYLAPSPRYVPLSLREDWGLEVQIRMFLGQDVDSYGVVVKRLSDGAGVSINADREFYAASLFKVLVMFEVFKQKELKLLSFDELLTFTPPYLEYGLGPERWPLWSKIAIRDLLDAMITESDNIAAIMLHDRTGGWNIIADFKSIGLTHTDISGEEMPTSAGDMAAWLEMIARGKAVNEDLSQEMVDLLARQKVNDRLPALLPQGIKVAHKTANWDNATHDVGVVYAPHGAYVIAVLSDKAWAGKPIAELSQLVYEYFEGQNAR